MTDLALVDLNLRECFRALAQLRQHGETRRMGGVDVLSLGVRFQMFNAAFLAFAVDDDADFERRVATASVHFAARGTPWSFWLCDGLLPPAMRWRAQRVLLKFGLTQATQMPGMIAAGMNAPIRALPPCEVREACDPAVLKDFREIGSRCFRVPADWFAEVFDDGMQDRAPFRSWVGYKEGAPVATAATVVEGEALGLYNVATHPDSRERGYAEALMRECVSREAGGRGAGLPLVLQSTATGLSLYKRLGFETVTRFRVWVS